jgi:hypothetical protein
VTVASLTTPAPIMLMPPPIARPLVSLSHLRLGYPASKRGRGRHEIRLTYRLSAAGTVEITIYRRVISHSCRRGTRTCIHYVPTRLEHKVTGHAAGNVVMIDIAKLSAGDYRLAVTPIAQSGQAGVTRYGLFKVVR